MSMVDNFEESLNAVRRFIYANVPNGISVQRLDEIEHKTHYFPLEFRRESEGVGCTLYVELDDYSATSITDEEGNRWRQYTVTAKPSWPSYGSVSVAQAQAFVKLISEVTEFADSLMKQFSQPITKLVETAEQIAARKQRAAEDSCREVVKAYIRRDTKGMRVGQERRIEVPPQAPDLLPIGEVTVSLGERDYTSNVTSTRTLCITRTR